ncbi:restriction endonuclease subunit S [Ureaplasma urealyticum]|uniref:restriction endonuclease subunit S n=1 Tax=Ureaplasma urealyticum TaxID=2130 RepID=UPI0001735896|nr:restriction endonuclease subunit S [Ureaplasma urealyticum]EDU06504.1 restriction-modification enzyme subunit s3a [Ureaplasma urealyticum serovar 5 str. ATCC 27817]EDX53534.1 restriction-modification enzyme subunit s3a [Ureaplasma urealyticum serovar 12 str. ATCC 33696]
MSIKLKDIIYAKRGSTITSNEFKINPGSYPLISASAQNNGVFGYINSYMYEGGHITISMNGNAGCVFYQKDKFSANSDVLVLSNIDNKISNNKFIFYWLKKHENTKIKSLCKGTTRLRLSNDDVLNLEINLPPIEEQNAIISIIEPLDILENKINKLKTVLKKLLINIYDKNCNSHVNLFENNKIYTNKYLNQNLYCDTSCIGELEINFSKMINISLEDKPSRADLSIKNNSIIFSKLLGENKVYCFLNNENIVFSTGFFNIKSNDENNDDLLSFLLSSDFKNQKSMLANGTTMIGINNSDLTKVRCKAPFLNSNIYFTFFNKLNEIENKITLARNKIVNLLIK